VLYVEVFSAPAQLTKVILIDASIVKT